MTTSISNERLLELLNERSGACLCGHFESCSVCTRTTEDRRKEKEMKDMALEILKGRGVTLQSAEHFGYANIPYYEYEIVES